jgi:hypothetical protein
MSAFTCFVLSCVCRVCNGLLSRSGSHTRRLTEECKAAYSIATVSHRRSRKRPEEDLEKGDAFLPFRSSNYPRTEVCNHQELCNDCVNRS